MKTTNLVSVILTAVFVFATIPVDVGNTSRAARSVVVKSGETILLRAYYRNRWRDCKSMKVTVKIVKEPEHGTVWQTSGYRDPYKATTTTGSGRCSGVKTRAYEFRYRSKKGFRGKDHVILRPIGFMNGVNQHFRITVM